MDPKDILKFLADNPDKAMAILADANPDLLRKAQSASQAKRAERMAKAAESMAKAAEKVCDLLIKAGVSGTVLLDLETRTCKPYSRKAKGTGTGTGRNRSDGPQVVLSDDLRAAIDAQLKVGPPEPATPPDEKTGAVRVYKFSAGPMAGREVRATSLGLRLIEIHGGPAAAHKAAPWMSPGQLGSISQKAPGFYERKQA